MKANRVEKTCGTCSKSFWVCPSRIARGQGVFCTRACMGLSRRLVPNERIERLVDRSGGPDACWPWAAKKNSGGYGSFEYLGKSYGAHRVAWEIAHGRSVPPGLDVRHVVCDNPPCCNPAHLEPGTDQDNANDKVRAGRQLLGSKHPRAVLTESIVIEIRRRLATGESQSKCARDLNLARGNVVNVALGKTWKHVTECEVPS